MSVCNKVFKGLELWHIARAASCRHGVLKHLKECARLFRPGFISISIEPNPAAS